MHRRALVTLLAASPLVLSPGLRAFAQSGGAAGRLPALDPHWLEQTMMLGAVALSTSRIALEKSRTPRVRQFAQFEVAEQETLAEVLKALQEPDQTATITSSSPQQTRGEPSLGPQGGLLADKLYKMEGADFERAYLAGQLEGHRSLLQVQEALIRAGGPREPVSIAKMARAQISEHIALLQDLQAATSAP